MLQQRQTVPSSHTTAAKGMAVNYILEFRQMPIQVRIRILNLGIDCSIFIPVKVLTLSPANSPSLLGGRRGGAETILTKSSWFCRVCSPIASANAATASSERALATAGDSLADGRPNALCKR